MREQEAFEKWVSDRGFSIYQDLVTSEYQDSHVQDMKDAWQAATAESAKRIAELESEVKVLDQLYRDACETQYNFGELQAHNNALREALDMLILTKEYKDKQGKDAVYESMRINAWRVAEEAITATPAESLQAHDNEVLERAAKVCESLKEQDYCVDVREGAEAIRALKDSIK